MQTNYIFRRLNGYNQAFEATRNAPPSAQSKLRYTGHKKAYLDEKGRSPRNVQDLTVITDMSKKSLEAAKDLKQPSTAHKQQKILRTNSSCKHLELSNCQQHLRGLLTHMNVWYRPF